MRRSTFLFTLATVLFTFALSACNTFEAPPPPSFDRDALSGVTYHLVGVDGRDDAVLLGDISFDERQGDALTGTWQIQPWGEQAAFAGMPAGGVLSGQIHGDVAIVQISFGDAQRSLGMIVEGFQGEDLVGSLTLLPDASFEGRFKARVAVDQ